MGKTDLIREKKQPLKETANPHTAQLVLFSNLSGESVSEERDL